MFYLRHGTSVCWYLISRLQSGLVTADLITTVAHSYKLLINDVDVHSRTQNEMQIHHILSYYSKEIYAELIKFDYDINDSF